MLIAHVTSDLDTAVTVVAFRGELTMDSKQLFRATVRKCLADQPSAVIVDLSELVDQAAGGTTPMFLALHREAEREPDVALLWCGARGDLAERLSNPGWRETLRIFDDRAQACAAATEEATPEEQVHLRLPANHEAPGVARAVVFDAIMSWGLREVAYRARQVISELAINAVEHAGTDFDVYAALRHRMVHLAVRDRSTVRPVLRDPADRSPGQPLAHRGQGLRIVENLAASWGCLVSDDGKIVWAFLRIPRD